MKIKKRNNQDLTIIEATQGQLDTKGRNWTDREFAYPARTIRVATSFSGIGAPEMALKRLELKSKIAFVCDIGERYLKYSYKQLAAFTAGLDEQKKKLFAQYLYDQNRANMETLLPDGKVNPIASLVCGIIAQFNSMERTLIRSRMASGYERYRREGGVVGRKRGYRKDDLHYYTEYAKELDLLKKGVSLKDCMSLTGTCVNTLRKLKRLYV